MKTLACLALTLAIISLAAAGDFPHYKPMYAFGCQSGTVQAHTYPVAPRWPIVKHIKFHVPYIKAPALSYGMYLLDSDKSTNVRAHVAVSGLNGYGFTLKLNTWAHTKQWGLGVSWMACPSE